MHECKLYASVNGIRENGNFIMKNLFHFKNNSSLINISFHFGTIVRMQTNRLEEMAMSTEANLKFAIQNGN